MRRKSSDEIRYLTGKWQAQRGGADMVPKVECGAMLASLPRSAWWLIAAALLVAWFSGIAVRKLQHPDEGRYAEIAREIAVSGNWVTPRLKGLKYFEKPPFQYWATAAAFNAFGVHEWTARLASAVAGPLAGVVGGVADPP